MTRSADALRKAIDAHVAHRDARFDQYTKQGAALRELRDALAAVADDENAEPSDTDERSTDEH